VDLTTHAIDVNPTSNMETEFYYIVHAVETGTSCISVDTVLITVNPAVVATATEIETEECRHGQNIIVVSATGGTQPYLGTDTFYVDGGFHIYTVTDDVGCSDTAGVNTIGELFFNLPDTI